MIGSGVESDDQAAIEQRPRRKSGGDAYAPGTAGERAGTSRKSELRAVRRGRALRRGVPASGASRAHGSAPGDAARPLRPGDVACGRAVAAARAVVSLPARALVRICGPRRSALAGTRVVRRCGRMARDRHDGSPRRHHTSCPRADACSCAPGGHGSGRTHHRERAGARAQPAGDAGGRLVDDPRCRAPGGSAFRAGGGPCGASRPEEAGRRAKGRGSRPSTCSSLAACPGGHGGCRAGDDAAPGGFFTALARRPGVHCRDVARRAHSSRGAGGVGQASLTRAGRVGRTSLTR